MTATKLTVGLHQLQNRMAHLWAKSPPTESTEGYPLFDHTLDVCWQAAQYYHAYRPNWPLADGVSLHRVLAYASLLHDFGKAHADFQRALRPPNPRFGNRHEILSLAFLPWFRVPDTERPWLAAAVASHHKGLHELFDPGKSFYATESFELPSSKAAHLAGGIEPDDLQCLQDFLGHAREAFLVCGWPEFELYEPSARPVPQILNILRNESELITHFLGQFTTRRSRRPGSQLPRDWRAITAAIHTRGLLINSDHLASFGRHPITTALHDVPEVRRLFTEKIKALNSFQERIACRVGCAILVAPTGSGKTEAALLWAAGQWQSGKGPGRTLFLLPYQASMNAMQERLIENIFPSVKEDRMAWNARVALAHGRSVRKMYEALLDQNYDQAEATRFAKSQDELARLHAAPISVSSPFALIRMILASRGAEGLWESASGARIIVDEVHAYEPRVTAMIFACLRFLIDHLNARVLFMTATLPIFLQEAILTAIPEAEVVQAGDDVMNQPARHKMRILDIDLTSDEAIERIKSAAKEKSVLAVVNQVGRAIALYRKLQLAGLDVLLLHSRFNYADRARIESELEPKRGRILVATQAVEVSLDVSFDECFSDLAPLESLQQRFGRCNRKGELPEAAPVTVCYKCPNLPYDKEHLKTTLAVLQETCDGRGQVPLTERLMKGLLDRSYPQTMKVKLAERIRASYDDITRVYFQSIIPQRSEPSAAGLAVKKIPAH